MANEWVTLAQLQTANARRNLEFLQTREHELATLPQNAAATEPLLFQAAEGGVRCRTAGPPERWILGEHDAAAESAEARRRVNDADCDNGTLIVCGGAIGYAAAAAAGRVLAEPRLRVVVIEPTPARVLAALLMADLAAALSTERLHLIASPFDPAALARTLAPLSLDSIDALVISPELDNELNAGEMLTRTREALNAAHESRTAILDRFRTAPRAESSISRVLVVNCWRNAPGDLHLRGIARAFESRGVKTETLYLNRYRMDAAASEFRCLAEPRVLAAVARARPDLIISYGYHAPQFVSPEAFEAVPARWVQAVSNIAYYDREQYPGEHLFVIEKRLIPMFEARGYRGVHFLPIMADFAGEAPAPSDGRMPVVMVGNSLALAPAARQAFRERINNREALLAAIDEAERALGDFDAHLNFYDYLEAHPWPQLDGPDDEYAIFRYLLSQSTAHRRRAVLERLAPLGLALFGGDWDSFLPAGSPLRSCLKGYLPIHEEPRVFAHGSIFVNIHSIGHVTGPNMRFFNVGGMGAFQISDNPQFSCYFEEDAECVFASTVDEFEQKTRDFLDHPEARDAIRSAAQQRVRRDWTYHNWVDAVMSEIGGVLL
ncbi:MAG: glycosyltransferase [bacterium]|nr:glycosyltransferase [bacterium]